MGFGKDGKGVIIRESRTQALATLAAATGLIIGTNLATLERFRIIKAEVYATVIIRTSGDWASLRLGLADGDFTLAEIEEAIEANGPLGPNDNVTEAIAERPVWTLGETLGRGDADPLVFLNETGGGKMSMTIRWTFSRTKSWNWFVYNQGEQGTTGATVVLRTKLFGVWVT